MSSSRIDEMDRLFEQMDERFARMRQRLAQTELGSTLPDMRWGREAAIELVDDEDAMLVVADIPGFEREEIDVTVRGTILHIAAEHEAAGEHVSRHRSFSERVTIPADIDIDEVTATYHNGVLEICLPFDAEGEEAHLVDVK